MPFTFASRPISKVAVIGSGQIGPDIALHFAKALQPAGVQVVVIDVSDAALQAGQARTWKKIDKGQETGAFSPDQAAAMKAALSFTSDYGQAAGAELVVEAATEDEGLKGRIFKQLEAIVAPGAILLSNSSHLEPERIFANLGDKSRAAVAHYFFPAERNVVIEIVAGKDTSPAVDRWLRRFYEAIGKVAIPVKSRYGYAADPVFEGVFQAACLCVEEGLGSIKEVDFAAREALGMTVGPFTAMNLTGGNPITEHGLDTMHERFASAAWPTPWFKAPKLLKDKLAAEGAAGKWLVCGRGETAELPLEQKGPVLDALRAAYLGITFGILDSGIITLGDFELCIETALDQIGPCRMANQLGVPQALALVQAYAATHPSMAVPQTLKKLAQMGQPIDVPNLAIEDVAVAGGVVRVVAIRRPKVLNALNAQTYRQIDAELAKAEAEPNVLGLVITGAGSKAFVSGADIGALAKVQTPQDGYDLANLGQSVGRRIELANKPVVAALNGLAFGGGLELAMACRARVAVAGSKALAGLPEVNLGILPGAGGTQRLPRLIGFARAWQLIRTAGTLSSAQALEFGLVRALFPADQLLDAAVALVAEVATGKVELPRLEEGTIAEHAEPTVEIGHRSQAVDAIVCDVMRTGATQGLVAGLQAELEGFKNICSLEDMRIGVQHFVQNGPKTPAPFVHK